MIASRGLIVDSRVLLDEAHDPWSIEFQSEEVRSRCSQLPDEEILRIEADAIEDVKDQCLMAPSSFPDDECPLIGHRVFLMM